MSRTTIRVSEGNTRDAGDIIIFSGIAIAQTPDGKDFSLGYEYGAGRTEDEAKFRFVERALRTYRTHEFLMSLGARPCPNTPTSVSAADAQ